MTVGLAILLVGSATGPIRAIDRATVGGRVAVHPLVATLVGSATQAPVGQKVHFTASIVNDGPGRVGPIAVELRSAATGLRIKGAVVQSISRLRPGQLASISWTVCGQTPGAYVLLARATLDGASVESAARLLTIVADRKGRCT